MKNNIIKFQTPDKFLLNGIFLGSEKAKNIFIIIHGLGGSLFGHVDLAEKLVDKNNSALLFNNRGHGVISKIYQFDQKNNKYQSHKIGMAHEVFTDCVDDIEGAVLSMQNLGFKNIFLVGHSTGCQKSIYYLAKKPKSVVRGVVLLAPMSDFADTYAYTDRKVYNMAVSFAQKLISDGKEHELLPEKIWPDTIDAQRFISLFTPDSVEEIFSYASGGNPKLLKSVKVPNLVVLAEKDEFMDREVAEIAEWFEKSLASSQAGIKIIKEATHGFQGYYDELAVSMKTWSKNIA